MARGRRKIWQEAGTRNGSRSHIMTVHSNPTTWARGGVSQAKNKQNNNNNKKPNKQADLTTATVGKLQLSPAEKEAGGSCTLVTAHPAQRPVTTVRGK